MSEQTDILRAVKMIDDLSAIVRGQAATIARLESELDKREPHYELPAPSETLAYGWIKLSPGIVIKLKKP